MYENPTMSVTSVLTKGFSSTDESVKEPTAETITPPKSPGLQSRELDSELLQGLYSDSVDAKIWGVALRALFQAEPPKTYPEYTDLTGSGKYVDSEEAFWTSGFFPACLYLLYERRCRWPQAANLSRPHLLKLKHACQWWSESLHKEALRTDTHDLGFMIQPWARVAWELDADRRSYDTLITAARSLASRYDERVGCMRSWDVCFTKRYHFDDPAKNYLVIIDNLMNLDLLYYASSLTSDDTFAEIATKHATVTMQSHIREDGSTCHVVDFDQETGAVRAQITNQGYSDTSCWSRGQAWAIVGFVQAYRWTKNPAFLDTSTRLADYFTSRLTDDDVPYWDFDAPRPGPRDSSAAIIAIYGMLLIHEAQNASYGTRDELPSQHGIHASGHYLGVALRMLKALLRDCMAPPALFITSASNQHEDVYLGDAEESILKHATINNYEFAPRKYSDHGLVYADYFFLLVGNKLLEMGLQI
ncbi:unsaturated glucuronyl hydrolase [Phlyctema vagabunda]|uniref:Unsaturated glucuronyl hydrolase n=1 Tax=Phlyctema vagabunda TaxID=108571 RepID=A0ABR4P9F6_9HELO